MTNVPDDGQGRPDESGGRKDQDAVQKSHRGEDNKRGVQGIWRVHFEGSLEPTGGAMEQESTQPGIGFRFLCTDPQRCYGEGAPRPVDCDPEKQILC
jgi:hypothetical protein